MIGMAKKMIVAAAVMAAAPAAIQVEVGVENPAAESALVEAWGEAMIPSYGLLLAGIIAQLMRNFQID